MIVVVLIKWTNMERADMIKATKLPEACKLNSGTEPHVLAAAAISRGLTSHPLNIFCCCQDDNEFINNKCGMIWFFFKWTNMKDLALCYKPPWVSDARRKVASKSWTLKETITNLKYCSALWMLHTCKWCSLSKLWGFTFFLLRFSVRRKHIPLLFQRIWMCISCRTSFLGWHWVEDSLAF